MSSKRMMQNVPKADVIIRNPTHFLQWLWVMIRNGNKARWCLAKGADRVALKIVEIGGSQRRVYHGKQAPGQSLYDAAEIDMEIPGEFYQPWQASGICMTS